MPFRSHSESAGGALAETLRKLDDAQRTFATLAPAGVNSAIKQMIATFDGIHHAFVAEYGAPDQARVGGPGSATVGSVDVPSIKECRKLSNRELAVWLTVVTVLCVNISLLVVDRIPRFAPSVAEEGVTPFDGSTVFIPFIFWAWLAYLSRSSNK